MPEPKVTEEQAEEALQQLSFPDGESEATVVPSAQVAEPSAEETVSVEAEPEAQPEVAEDDLESLRTRNEELGKKAEQADERFKERLAAQQERYAANEQILRDRYLRKSTAADRALKALRKTTLEDGVTREEVDQVIREMEGTMHPESASHVAPVAEQPMTGREEQSLILNSFLSEQGMTQPEADEFGKWIRSDAEGVMTQGEQAVAKDSLDGFLRLAHRHWEVSKAANNDEKRNDAVAAVKSVKRTQREAARAASATPGAPRKQPAGTVAQDDLSKLTDDDISSLLRQSVEQYQ